jgi:kojibiose phosphorylase
VLVETARYWMERITFDDRHRLAGPRILGVMGPDEYKPITRDNAYTNRMVAHALRLAVDVAAHVGVPAPEAQSWRATAAALPVRFDATGTLVLQCDGFDRFAEPEFDRFWLDPEKTFAAQVSQERLYRSKCLKQADVLMLMALLPDEFTAAQLRRAWDYYLQYTTHDSSLSAGIHCLLACRLGLDDQAWSFWHKGSRQDLPGSNGGDGGAAEGIHIAGAGAIWQMAIMGFGGVRSAMHAQELTLTPRLPKLWTSLSFPLVWKGQAVHIEIHRRGTRIRNRSARPLPVTVNEVRRTIAPGAEETFE